MVGIHIREARIAEVAMRSAPYHVSAAGGGFRITSIEALQAFFAPFDDGCVLGQTESKREMGEQLRVGQGVGKARIVSRPVRLQPFEFPAVAHELVVQLHHEVALLLCRKVGEVADLGQPAEPVRVDFRPALQPLSQCVDPGSRAAIHLARRALVGGLSSRPSCSMRFSVG